MVRYFDQHAEVQDKEMQLDCKYKNSKGDDKEIKGGQTKKKYVEKPVEVDIVKKYEAESSSKKAKVASRNSWKVCPSISLSCRKESNLQYDEEEIGRRRNRNCLPIIYVRSSHMSRTPST